MRKLRVGSVQRRIRSFALVALGVVAGAGLAIAAGPGPASGPAPASPAPAASTTATPAALMDINSASRAQLKTLPGIGDAEADKIIAGRPYLSKAHLVSEIGLPLGTYLSIKNRIIAVQNKEAQAKLQAKAKALQAQTR